MTKPSALLTTCLIFLSSLLSSQSKKALPESKTKLVVGIVVDQMRNDYISRYWSRFGNGGFKRLVNDGYYFKNAHFNYIPTYTGPGHASIYTGATPRAHGIIANDWYSKKNNKTVNCVYDSTAQSSGTKNKNGTMSPRNLLSSTIGDELKMSSNRRSKVFSFALKDRSAVLPAGHAANGAFWYDDVTGDFISSSWYMADIPRWLKNFNDERYPKTYLEKGWSPLYALDTYTASISDQNKYESAPNKKETADFPYDYKNQIDAGTYGILKGTPYGNSYTKDVAIECLKKEVLGKQNETDLLCISFSAPDIISHAYGTRAVEVEDTYLRLDKDIEEILNALDKEVGKDNYIVFLTADHGGADVPNHLIDEKIPAGYIYEKNIERSVKAFFQKQYGDSLLILNVSNEQIFINEKKLDDMKLNRNDVEEKLSRFVITIPGIAEAYSSSVIKNEAFTQNDYRALLQNGFNHKLSGNVCLIYSPAWMDYAQKGTSHGAGYNYDTHVPVIFYGKGIKKGSSWDYVTITQIAPTVCELIGINRPNSTIAVPLNNAFR